MKTIEESEDSIKLNKEDVFNKEDDYLLNAFKILARRRLNINLNLPLINSLNNLENKDLKRNYN